MHGLPRTLAFLIIGAVLLSLPVAVVEERLAEAAGTVGAAGFGLNLGFDEDAQDTGVTPDNHDFSQSSSFSGPSNYDFEGGSLSPWTSPTSGFVQVGSGGNPGKYGKASAAGPTLESASFTIPADAQTISWDDVKTETGGTYSARIWDGSTETTIAALITATGSWTSRTYNIHSFRGQSITVRFKSVSKGVGFDNVKFNTVIPDWDHNATGTNVVELGAGGYAKVKGGTFATTDPITIPDDAEVLKYFHHIESGASSTYSVEFLTGASFTTVETIKSAASATSNWWAAEWNIEEWQGETVKLRFSSITNTLGLDDIQIWVNIPAWDIGPNPTSAIPHTGPSPLGSAVIAGNGGTLVSQPVPYSRYVTYIRRLDAASGGSSCVQFILLNDDDLSTIGKYDDVSLSECGTPSQAWATLNGGLSNAEQAQWHGGLVRYKLVFSGTAAFDLANNGVQSDPDWPSAKSEDPVDFTSGSWVHQHTDFVVPGRGVPLQFTRFYNSSSGANSVMGQNWSHSYAFSLSFGPDSSITVNYPSGNSKPFTSAGGGSYTAPAGTFDTLQTSGSNYVLKTKNQVSYTFNSSGRLTSIADRSGNTTSLSYDGDNQLSTVTDPGGRSISFTYDAVVSGVSVPRGVPSMPFSNSGFEGGNYTNWTKTGTAYGTSPATQPGTTNRYANSDSGGNSATGTLTSTTFKAGHVLSFRLGGKNDPSNLYAALVVGGSDVITQAAPVGGRENLQLFTFDTSAYVGQNAQLKVVDNSTTDHINFDDLLVTYGNHVTRIDIPLSRHVDFTYDTLGNLETVTDIKGGTTTYDYAGYKLSKLTDSENHEVVRNFYDPSGRVYKQFNGIDDLTCFYYGWGTGKTDANCPGVSPAPTDARTVIVDAEGHKTTYAADDKFRTIQIKDHNGGTTDIDYDSSNNAVCVTDPLSHRTAYAYDGTGNVTDIIDGNNTNAGCTLKVGGHKWTMTYTAKNDVDLLTDPEGRITDFVYDGNGNVTDVIRKDSGGTVVLRTCYTRHGTYGLVTEIIESVNLTNCTGGNKTKLTYDTKGNLTEIVDPRFAGQGSPPKTVLDYDNGGRLLTVTNELNHTTTFTYDEAGAVLTVNDHQSHETAYTYDNKGKIETITDPNLNVTSYFYDDADRLIKVTDALSQDTEYLYDGVGNLKTVTNARLKDTLYGYDELNRLTSVEDALGRVTSYTYDAASRPETRTDAEQSDRVYFRRRQPPHRYRLPGRRRLHGDLRLRQRWQPHVDGRRHGFDELHVHGAQSS